MMRGQRTNGRQTMMNGSKVISADGHVVEPGDLWLRYIEPKYRERAPRIKSNAETDYFWIEGMNAIPLGFQSGAGRRPQDLRADVRFDTDVPRGAWDPKARRKDMELDGIDGEVLYPSVCLQLFALRDLDFMYACFEAYNNWMNDLCKADPAHLKGIGLIALDDIERAVQELYRCKEIGLSGGMIPVAPDDDRPYSDPLYEPFWAAAEESGLPISLHSSTHREGSRVRAKGFADNVVKPHAVQRTIADMVFAGVFDRYPKLKLVSAESDCGWAAHYLMRMDHKFTSLRNMYNNARISGDIMPSEYVKRQVYYTFMIDPVGIRNRDLIGVGNLLWASDYPHHESTWPRSHQIIERQCPPDISAEDKRKIIGENAARLYGFSLS